MTHEGGGQTSETKAEQQREEIDNVLDALSNPYRRHTLYYLRERGTTSVEELVTVLTGWLSTDEEGLHAGTPGHRREVAIVFHHNHLPKLTDYGFVRHDPDSETVELGAVPDSLTAYLDLSLEVERASQRSEPSGSSAADEPR